MLSQQQQTLFMLLTRIYRCVMIGIKIVRIFSFDIFLKGIALILRLLIIR